MASIVLILLLGIAQLFLSRSVAPKSWFIQGTKIPISVLESKEGMKGLRRIKLSFLLSGSITLLGGIFCVILNRTDFLFWILFGSLTISVFFLLIQLCLIQKKKKEALVVATISATLLAVCSLAIHTSTAGNDVQITLKNDTLFIGGTYPKTIPIADITHVKRNATVPPIKIRTNGISIGPYNIGHFRTTSNKDILLYLHSIKTCVTHIKTAANEDIYINLSDSLRSVEFCDAMEKALYNKTTESHDTF